MEKTENKNRLTNFGVRKHSITITITIAMVNPKSEI